MVNGYDVGDTGSAQEKWKDTDKSGGLLSFYAAEAVVREYDAAGDGYDSLMAAMLRLKDGWAIGFDIKFYADGQLTEASSHALTFMGYIRDTGKEGGDALCAVFYSDSDNDKFDYDTRSEPDNSLCLMNVVPSTVIPYDDREVTYLAMPGTADIYSEGSDNDVPKVAHITGYHVLEACGDDSMTRAAESVGSMEPLENVDYVVDTCSVQDKTGSNLRQLSVGDKALLYVQLANHSYTMLDLTTKPYVMMNYTITRDDEIVVIRQMQVFFDDSVATDQAPNKIHRFKLPTPLSFQIPGHYTVSVSIEGLYTGEGEPITEAYTANNSSAEYSFTVEGTAIGEDPELLSEETIIVRPTPNVEATFSRNSFEPFEVTISGQSADGLELMQEGKIITEAVCSIISRDGDTVLCFDAEFIDATYSGLHQYMLQNADGTEVAQINIHVEEDDLSEEDVSLDDLLNELDNDDLSDDDLLDEFGLD